MVLLSDDDDVPPLLVGDDGVFNTSHWFEVRDELELALPIDQPRAHTMRCHQLLWTYAYDNVPPPLVIICDNHSSHHTTAVLSLMAMANEVLRGPTSPCNSNHGE